ncbi:MAG: hypothetical protein Q8K99_02830 [Actinomycetota bacterium]|nr:hypothetical protein [Actinomycetota bacterium]
MTAYRREDVYRVVDAEGGGVRVMMPGGFATTAIEVRYATPSDAAAAIERAIKDGLPAFEVVDETGSAKNGQMSKTSKSV